MLRTQPPDVYDQWVTNEIPFNDPAVVARDRRVRLVRHATTSSSMAARRRSPRPTSATARRASSRRRRKCYMHRQASFIPSFFPEGTKLGEDADFFYFPAYAGKDLGKPVLGAGTLAIITKDTPGRARLHRLAEDADRA